MRRVIVPALLAVCIVAGNSADAGFGLFDRLCNRGCDAAPVCEPSCGYEIAQPVCGCEVVDPCCNPRPKFGGLFKKLFNKNNGCDAAPCCDIAPVCEPTCGCEIAPVDCGCAVIEPACGCEPAPCHKPLFGGVFKKLFKKNTGCSDPCAIEPACGCEPTCGIAPSCGCGM